MDFSKIPVLIQRYRVQINVPQEEKIQTCLGIDATKICDDPYQMMINQIYEKVDSVFAFLLLPLNPAYPVYTLHLSVQPHGIMGSKMRDIIHEILSLLCSSNIDVRYVSTDGDRSYLPFHKELFFSYTKFLDGGIESICATLSENNNFFTSDILHIMKNMRCRLRKCLSIGNYHDHDGVPYFSTLTR